MKESFMHHVFHRFPFCRTRTRMSAYEDSAGSLEKWVDSEKTNPGGMSLELLCSSYLTFKNMSHVFLNLRKKSRWISHNSFAGSKATSCPYKRIWPFTCVIYWKIIHMRENDLKDWTLPSLYFCHMKFANKPWNMSVLVIEAQIKYNENKE